MGSGSGGGIADRFIDGLVGAATAGAGSITEDGFQFEADNIFEDFAGVGRAFRAGEADLKEVTGAAAAEEANEAARIRFEEERAASEEQRKQNVAQSAANQLAASRSAASARGGVSSTSSDRGQSRFSNLGSDESDFLGL